MQTNCVIFLRVYSVCHRVSQLWNSSSASSSLLLVRSLVFRVSWMSGCIKQMFPSGKSCKHVFPPSALMWGQTHSCLLITQPPKNVYYRASRGETSTESKLAALQPTFNFRVLITACTSDTFSSITWRTQLVSGCGDSAWGRSTAACNRKFLCRRQQWCHANLKFDAWFPASSEVRDEMLVSLNQQMLVEVTISILQRRFLKGLCDHS